MAILGGLFSKKAKSKSKPPPSVTSTLVTDFDIESLNDESEHDHTLLHPGSVYQNAAASSSKMKLPFGRSKSKVDLPATPTDMAHSSLQYSIQSEPPAGPLTPPQKSVLGGYGDSGSALTTKSLPNVNHTRSESHETVKTTTPASAGKRSGRGLFSWARDRKKSKPPPPPPLPRPSEFKGDSFNLRAFRHVSGPETAPSTSALDDDSTPLDLPPARPRPRGDSVASDTSQRVSVAAFREMQARRSQAGSPSPQPNSRPSTQIEGYLRPDSPSLKLLPSTPNSSSQPRGLNVAPRAPHRTSTLRASPSSKSDPDSDSDHGPSPLSVQWRSKSELGHSSLPDHRPSNGPPPMSSQFRQGRTKSDAPRPEKKSPIPVSVHAPARPAAIQSRSSSRPSAQNVLASSKNTSGRPMKDSDTSSSSDDSSDDDAPLATLVQPRRPGSAASHTSGRSLPKPLIDIKSLSNSPLSNTPQVSSINSSPPVRSDSPTSSRNDARPPTNINERLSSLAQGLTRPKPTYSVVSESTVKTDGDKAPPLARGQPAPNRSVTASPDALPSVEKPLASVTIGESSPPPRSSIASIPDKVAASPSVNTTEFPTFKSPRASLSLDDPTPIKPTPIHHRTPQSAFSVMSRPHHGATPSTSMPATLSQGEPVDAIGDFTAAMFSQIDLGFSIDGAESLDSTIKKGPSTMTTEVTTPSSTAPSEPISQAVGPTLRMPNNVGKESAAPTRSVPFDALPSQSRVAPSESATSGRSLRRPRSSTLVASTPPQTSKLPNNKPQPTSRTQPQRPVKSIPDVSSSRKAAITSQAQAQPQISRHKRSPSTGSTSSESSYGSSSSSPSVAPRKQKPQPQPRPQQPTSRPRSATLGTPIAAIPPSPTNSSNTSSSPAFNRPPQRPFAMRNNSPSSSTGDSSSGRLPITPRDGSEVGSELGRGIRGKRQAFRAAGSLGVAKDGLLSASNSEMGLKAKKLTHRKSASYDDSTLKAAMKKGGSGVATSTDEERRRERRRSEAKNAIELGKVMNGNIKLEDDDPTMGMNPRMSTMNPMIGMGMPMGMGMRLPQQTMPMMMGNPWISQPNPMLQPFMAPPPQGTDPQLLAAHQHAMMVAKQAYQLAVAQQAMQAAGDEWERGSTLGWPSNASTSMFPAGPRSMYTGSIYGGSEYGGPTSGWATSSVYGGGFGPSTSNRNSAMIRNYQQNGPSASRDSRIDLPSTNSPEIRQPRPRVKTGPNPSDRPIATLVQQQQKGRGRTPPPPSSWKRGAKP